MNIDEIIEVLQAYKEGKEIEVCEIGTNNWMQIDYPGWNFDLKKYRVKKNPTNLEIANKLIKEAFGVEDFFDTTDCPIRNCNYCEDLKIPTKDCAECITWWEKEYKEMQNE